MMVLCCLRELSGAKKAGDGAAGVLVDPLEVLRFISAGFEPMNEMFERSRQPEMAIYQRTKAVFEYFNFPFDQPPPA
jgi:hypothetical protein